eukprot:12390163-Alexandrium_andersonii.AAC.1
MEDARELGRRSSENLGNKHVLAGPLPGPDLGIQGSELAERRNVGHPASEPGGHMLGAAGHAEQGGSPNGGSNVEMGIVPAPLGHGLVGITDDRA